MSSSKPTIIGLYGLPGSGKTTILNQIKKDNDLNDFLFFESSEVLDEIALPIGGLDSFKKLPENEKEKYRIDAISDIQTKCAEAGKAGVVAGHFMFWNEGDHEGQCVCTEMDLCVYTHIIYLDCDADDIYAHRSKDSLSSKRKRDAASVEHLEKWQQKESSELRQLCHDRGILFSTVPDKHMVGQTIGTADYSLSPIPSVVRVKNFLKDFRLHNSTENLSRARARLDDIIQDMKPKPSTMIVFDADRTLTAVDTGDLFWESIDSTNLPENYHTPLKRVFSSPLGYSYDTFLQASLLYSEAGDATFYENHCRVVASQAKLYPELLELIETMYHKKHVRMVIVTCGLQRVWEMVLKNNGLDGKISVIGAGQISHPFVVTAAVKAALVDQLQTEYHVHVWAFGDSPLDLDMFKKADQAVVVVGSPASRSKTMEAALRDAIDFHGLRARQVLVPDNEDTIPPSRLSEDKLPVIKLDQRLHDSILDRRIFDGRKIVHATNRNSAMILMSSMRDAKFSGSALRDVHRRVEWYLANEYVSNMVGIEKYEITHVQGHKDVGYRFLHEKHTIIVPLMRGGEPMAFGVSDAFPCAWFVHAKAATDLTPEHLKEKQTVILVDSVINEGTSVMEFVEYLRKTGEGHGQTPLRIVVVTGVAQAKSITSETKLGRALQSDDMLSLVALRLSDNKFKGKGTTDTGHRLFNTTSLD